MRNITESVRTAFAKAEYVNSRTKVQHIRPKGHIGSVLWGNWRKGLRCKSKL